MVKLLRVHNSKWVLERLMFGSLSTNSWTLLGYLKGFNGGGAHHGLLLLKLDANRWHHLPAYSCSE